MAYTLLADIGCATTNFAFTNSNPCNIMTDDNEVMLCDDVECTGVYQANTAILTLSSNHLSPDYNMKIPVVVSTIYGDYNEILDVKTDGTISVNNCFYNPIFRLDGIKWHINNKYYTPAIGNIYNDGTSPLDAK